MCDRTCRVGAQAPVLVLLPLCQKGPLPLCLGGRQAYLGPGLGWVVQSWLSFSLCLLLPGFTHSSCLCFLPQGSPEVRDA